MRRFIILAHQRSGSALLVDALAQHPSVRMHSELLSNTTDEEERRRVYSVAGRWLRDTDDGAEFLGHVFTPRAGEAAAGFKLMHYHAASPPTSSAWDFLRADTGIRVIHLWRDDLLRCLVSDHVAQRTRVWHVYERAEPPKEPVPFPLSPECCWKAFRDLDGWRARAREWFAGHPFLELEYQRDLERDFGAALTRVFEFLGVPPVSVEKRVVKLARRSPREQLSNFDELAATFAGTPYARFFAG